MLFMLRLNVALVCQLSSLLEWGEQNAWKELRFVEGKIKLGKSKKFACLRLMSKSEG